MAELRLLPGGFLEALADLFNAVVITLGLKAVGGPALPALCAVGFFVAGSPTVGGRG